MKGRNRSLVTLLIILGGLIVFGILLSILLGGDGETLVGEDVAGFAGQFTTSRSGSMFMSDPSGVVCDERNRPEYAVFYIGGGRNGAPVSVTVFDRDGVEDGRKTKHLSAATTYLPTFLGSSLQNHRVPLGPAWAGKRLGFVVAVAVEPPRTPLVGRLKNCHE